MASRNEDGLTDIVKLLLESGADRSLRNTFGETPFDLAERIGRTEITQLLSFNKGAP